MAWRVPLTAPGGGVFRNTGGKRGTDTGRFSFQPRLCWSFQVVSDLRRLGNGNKWLRLLRLALLLCRCPQPCQEPNGEKYSRKKIY
ncbi:hypothetical protein SRHO_G00296320 [Serrasalmus rhombeus]